MLRRSQTRKPVLSGKVGNSTTTPLVEVIHLLLFWESESRLGEIIGSIQRAAIFESLHQGRHAALQKHLVRT